MDSLPFPFDVNNNFSSKRELYELCKSKAEDLYAKAQLFLKEGRDIEYQNKTATHEEVATRSAMKRGFYCPSPVWDLLVGNCPRGKLLKRPNIRSRISHRYLFDDSGIYMILKYGLEDPNRMLSTEYLLRDEDSVVGITLSESGEICELSEEKYIEGKITEYLWVWYNEPAILCSGTYERFLHDEQGIIECDHNDIGFYKRDMVQERRYRFIREDGWLKSYYSMKDPEIIYTPGVKRLALPPYFVKNTRAD